MMNFVISTLMSVVLFMGFGMDQAEFINEHTLNDGCYNVYYENDFYHIEYYDSYYFMEPIFGNDIDEVYWGMDKNGKSYYFAMNEDDWTVIKKFDEYEIVKAVVEYNKNEGDVSLEDVIEAFEYLIESCYD